MITATRKGNTGAATALAALTGEPHPLAIKDPGTGPSANPALIWLALQPEPPAQARTSIPACGHHGVIGMILWSPAGTAGCRYWRCLSTAAEFTCR